MGTSSELGDRIDDASLATSITGQADRPQDRSVDDPAGPSALFQEWRSIDDRSMAPPGTERIVVGVDESTSAERALRWAFQEALRRGATLEVVHAWRVPFAMHPNAQFVDASIFKDRAVDTLDDAIEAVSTIAPDPSVRPSSVRPSSVRPSVPPSDVPPSDVPPIVIPPIVIPPIVIQGVLAEGDAAAALLTAAAGARLLVVGSRGYGGFVGLLLGSVSQRCLDHAPCPIAVIPSTWDGTTRGRVVVGVDGSEASYGALHWAIAEAVRRQTCLDVVNTYGFHQYVSPFGRTFPIERDVLEESSQALLENMVEEAIGGCGQRPPAVELIPTPMSTVLALLDISKGADLLVVGARGHGGLHGMLTGSVSQQCVHHARCPIVVVRPPRCPNPNVTVEHDSQGDLR